MPAGLSTTQDSGINGALLQGELRPLQVKKGDRILFGKDTGNDIKIDGVDHLILREDDVLGLIEK